MAVSDHLQLAASTPTTCEARRMPAPPALPRVFKKPRSLRFVLRLHPIHSRYDLHPASSLSLSNQHSPLQLPAPFSPLALTPTSPVFDVPIISISDRTSVVVTVIDNVSDHADDAAMESISKRSAHVVTTIAGPVFAGGSAGGCRANGIGSTNVRTRSRQYSLRNGDRPDISMLQQCAGVGGGMN
ncbi:hypothetical protein HDU84_000071 [Entophlyctis sp. JEL0112]|nr:hypothetical protein HDU84_000071 [Entophlyctis sp. JEL0112]